MTDALRALPCEFLQPDELAAMTGRRQPAAWRRWLDRIGVRYVVTPAGYPLVYRDRLTPAQDGPKAAPVIDLEVLRHGARRKAAQGR